MVASLGLLGLALKTLPLGTAYAVWTGVGTLGTAVLGDRPARRGGERWRASPASA